MKFLVLGYSEQRKGATGIFLYGGENRDEALQVLEKGGRGILRTEIFQHLQPFKNRNFEPVEGEEFQQGSCEDGSLTITDELRIAFEALDQAAIDELLYVGGESPDEAILAYVEACKAIDQDQYETFDSLGSLAQLVGSLFSERKEFRAENVEVHAENKQLTESRDALVATWENVVKKVEAERDALKAERDGLADKLTHVLGNLERPTTEPPVPSEKESAKEELDLKAGPKGGGKK